MDNQDIKRSKALSGIGRELQDKDLSSPGVQKMLIERVDQLENVQEQLEMVKTQFHEKDKKCAVLEEKLNSSKSFEILYSVAEAVGAALVGLCFSIDSMVVKIIVIVFGSLMLIGANLAKYLKK